MHPALWLFAVLFIGANAQTSGSIRNQTSMVFFPSPPYIYQNRRNLTDKRWIGIIPDILEKTKLYCDIDIRPAYNLTFEDFVESLNGRATVDSAAEEKLWLALTHRVTPLEQKSNNLISHTLFETGGLALVVPRWQIGMIKKITDGIYRCKYIVLYSILMAIVAGAIIWACERFNNEQFEKCFEGVFTGFWFGLVTMTTIGYGDVTPRSMLGKVLTCIWMIIGILTAGVLTAMVTGAVTGSGEFSPFESEIAVKAFSEEESYATYKYRSKVTAYSTYLDVIFALRQGKQPAALLNYDIASHMQSALRNSDGGESQPAQPLRVVQLLDDKSPIKILLPGNGSQITEAILKCWNDYPDDIITMSILRHRQLVKVETSDFAATPREIFIDDKIGLAIVIASCGILGLGLILEIAWHSYLLVRKKIKRSCNEGHSADAAKEISEKKINAFSDDSKELRKDLNKMSGEIRTINETILKLKLMVDYKNDYSKWNR